jgi:hypothetical protein
MDKGIRRRSYRRRLSRALCGLAVFALFGTFSAAGVATAAQGTDASISGQVTDESGAVLPGVTVTITSPALQVPSMTVVTDERGEYRVAPLPIGTFTVVYTLAGFQTVRREEVRLTVGFAARLDVSLNVGSLEESVTVSGASPVVDLTSTATRTEFTKETLELLPTGRSGYIALLAQAPGVRTNFDIGGDAMVALPVFRAFGQTSEGWATIEGIYTTGPKDSQSGNYFDYSMLEEARVQTVGNDAEMARRGISLAGVVKSGGNQTHGTLFLGQSFDELQSDNLDDELRAAGIQGQPRITRRWDRSAEIGGPIMQNRLWYYGAGRWRRSDWEVPNGLLDNGAPWGLRPDGSPVVRTQNADYYTNKLSYQMSPANRFVGFNTFHHKHHQGSTVTRFVPHESRNDETLNSWTGKIEWQGIYRGSLATSAQIGTWRWRDETHGNSDRPSTIDIRTQMVSGVSTAFHEFAGERNVHAKGSLAWYKTDLLGGNHDFKFGFDHIQAVINRYWVSRPQGNYQLRFDNGVPIEMVTRNHPNMPFSNADYLGLYAKDTWTIARRLTLNLGLRMVPSDSGYVPEQCREDADPPEFAPASCQPRTQLKIWRGVAPRFHAAYDLTGDGRTLVKGGYGRFDHMREIDPEVTSTNRQLNQSTTWRWRDLNNNRVYDAGEVNLDPNGPDFLMISGLTNAVPNPNEIQPKSDEFSLQFEREVMRNFGVRVTTVYSRNFNTYRLLEINRPYSAYSIPITNPDPGPDGVLRTADDPGTSFSYYEYPASLAGRQFASTMLINDPNADHTYKSIELAAARRLADGWQFSASFSATKSHIPFGAEQLAFNPNAEINVANDTWEWLGKASGAYFFPAQIVASFAFEHRSGNPEAREVLFRGGRQIPTLVVKVEPVGSSRLPNTNLLDLRVERRFSIGPRQLAARLNVFNVLNKNTVTTRNIRSGADFLRPTAIMLPRIAEANVTFTF